jgi:hypothetical protein
LTASAIGFFHELRRKNTKPTASNLAMGWISADVNKLLGQQTPGARTHGCATTLTAAHAAILAFTGFHKSE